jgi:hypothetical protein
MFFVAKSDELLCDIRAYFSVLALEEQQRIALIDYDLFHFRDKDRVIAGFLGRVESAFEIGQRSVEHRRAMGSPVEPRAGLGFGAIMRPLRPRIVLRNRPLIITQHVHPESFLGMQMRVRPRAVIHANQHQHGIERHRRKRIRGHSVHFTIEINRDNRDPSRETSHGFSKLFAI